MLIAKEMRWDEELNSPEKISEIIDKIRAKNPPLNIYLICQRGERTEIISCRQAVKDVNKPNELRVIGAAKGRDRAFEMLAEMYREKL